MRLPLAISHQSPSRLEFSVPAGEGAGDVLVLSDAPRSSKAYAQPYCQKLQTLRRTEAGVDGGVDAVEATPMRLGACPAVYEVRTGQVPTAPLCCGVYPNSVGGWKDAWPDKRVRKDDRQVCTGHAHLAAQVWAVTFYGCIAHAQLSMCAYRQTDLLVWLILSLCWQADDVSFEGVVGNVVEKAFNYLPPIVQVGTRLDERGDSSRHACWLDARG